MKILTDTSGCTAELFVALAAVLQPGLILHPAYTIKADVGLLPMVEVHLTRRG